MSPSTYDDNDEIEGLSMWHQIVHYVPKFTVKIRKRLHIIQIYGCGLKELTKEDLKQFPQLRHLFLDKNDLEWLKSDVFVFNPKLEEISFLDNEKLKFIGANLLDSLPKLWNADFRSAGCIHFFAGSPETLNNLKTELKTKCKDEETKLKVPAERTTSTITTSTISTTEFAALTTLVTSQTDENPTEASA
jgi:hypothetical protein